MNDTVRADSIILKVIRSLVNFMNGISIGALTLLQLIQTLIVVVVLGLVVYFGVLIFANFHTVTTRLFGSEQITGVSETDALVTSIAQIDLLRVGMSNTIKGNFPRYQKLSSIHWYLEFDMISKAKTFCLNTYTVSFGYPSVADASSKFNASGKLPSPEVIAINPVRAESGPEALDSCELFNSIHRRDSLIEDIEYVLEHHDHILDDHMRQGGRALASYIDLGKDSCFGKVIDSSCALSMFSDTLKKKREEITQRIDSQKSELKIKEKTLHGLYPAVLNELAGSSVGGARTINGLSLSPLELNPSTITSRLAEDVTRYRMTAEDALDTAPAISDLQEQYMDYYYRDTKPEGLGQEGARTGSRVQAFMDLLNEYLVLDNVFKKDFIEVKEINSTLAQANLGVNTMTITVSLIGAVSQKVDWIWGLITFNNFYIKKDIAKVLYGSSYSSLPFLERDVGFWTPFSEQKIVEIPRPSVIAIDRWTQKTSKRGKLKDPSGSNVATYSGQLNAQMTALLDNAIKRIDAFAVQSSKNIIRNRMLAKYSSDSIRIRFIRGDNTEQLGLYSFEKTKNFTVH